MSSSPVARAPSGCTHAVSRRAWRTAHRVVQPGAPRATVAMLRKQHGTVIVSPPCDITDPTQLSAIAAEYGGAASLVDRARGRQRDLWHHRVMSAAVVDNFAAKVLGLAQMIMSFRGRCARMCETSAVFLGDGGGVDTGGRVLGVQPAARRDGRPAARPGWHCVAVKWGLWQAPKAGETSAPGIAVTIARVERSLDSARWRPAGDRGEPARIHCRPASVQRRRGPVACC